MSRRCETSDVSTGAGGILICPDRATLAEDMKRV